ncbi:hypothetical protein QJS66_04090 [Kocuria rhizophila]|nr:hypothetical protein QJS66_04090 [Kocuria rhizophila]
MSLGGAGYAVDPAHDLGPRIARARCCPARQARRLVRLGTVSAPWWAVWPVWRPTSSAERAAPSTTHN